MSNNKIILHENPVELDIIDDYFKVAKKCRDSYFQLFSLKRHFDEVTINISLPQVKMLSNEANKLINRFIEIDIISCSDANQDTITQPNFRETEDYDIYKRLKGYIDLSCQLDKVQIDMFNFLVNLKRDMSKDLAKENPLLNTLFQEFESEYYLEIMFLHSSEESNILNYKLIAKRQDVKKDLRNKNITLPEFFNIQDYSYIVNKRRIEYRHWYRAHRRLVQALPKLMQENYLHEISKKQYYYNKHITYLTYSVTTLTIITTFTAIISTYFGLIDHWGLVLSILGKS